MALQQRATLPESDITTLTLVEAREKLRSREISALELTTAYINRMNALQHLNAYITPTSDKAIEMATTSDQKIKNNQAGLLEGIPIAMKDLFCTKDVKTTAASKILHQFVPTYESTVSQRLWNQGAVMLGKTNLDEFAMGSSNLTSHFGGVINPWRSQSDPQKDLVPGGSSGGSAAAVAARMAIAATGTDTGGSIRQPASFCHLVGMKPTYGRCSRWGIVAFASSLDQAGPMTRTVADAALMLQAMCGHDPKDSTSAKKDVPDFYGQLRPDLRGKRIGIPREYRVDNMPSDIDRLWQQGIAWVRDAGAEIVDMSLPHTAYALPTYYIIAPAEASSNLARYDGVRYGLRIEGETLDAMYENTRAEGFGSEVKRRILIGTYVLSAGYYDAYYRKAQRVRAKIVHDFKQAFESVDAILTPTTPGEAFGVHEKNTDPLAMYLNDVFTVPASLAGLPAISVPVGFSAHDLPLGLQVIGPAFDEQTVLNVGNVLEQAANVWGRYANC